MKNVFFQQTKKSRAQAAIEFALVMPVLILLIYGTIEVGRLIFIYASVNNASRQAARYGAASGEGRKSKETNQLAALAAEAQNLPPYQDCDGIRETADLSAFIQEFSSVNITYDRGVDPAGKQIPIEGIDSKPGSDNCPIVGDVRNGDRIIVEVSAEYEPILPLIPIQPIKITSVNARTFIVSVPIIGSAMPTGFKRETSTPSRIPTFATFTPTVFITNTPVNTFPPNYTPPTPVPPTATFTPSNTPLPSQTPSITPTPIMCNGLAGISHGPLIFNGNSMSMEIINNTGHELAVAQTYVEWNHDTGHRGGDVSALALRRVTLGSSIWTGDIFSPSTYIEAYYPIVPMGMSNIVFIFHQTYDVQDNTERILISLSTPGCVNYPIDSSK